MIDTILTATLLSFASFVSAAPAATPPAVVRSTFVPTAELVALCARDASGVDKALSDPKMAMPISAAVGTEGLVLLQRYGVCRSLQGAPDGCTVLGALGGNYASSCGEVADRYRFIHQMFRSGDGVGVCRKLGESMGKRGPAVDRACAALAAGVKAGDAASACPELAQAGMQDSSKDCADRLLSWKGNPASCASLKNPWQSRECREDASLVAGLRDPALCAASSACLALESKQAATCGKHREEIFRMACARVSEAAVLEQKRVARMAEEALRQTERNKKLEADAVYATKLRAEALAKMKAESAAAKKQFKKNAPMSNTSEVLTENMRRQEQGLQPLSDAEMAKLLKSRREKAQGKTPTPGEPQPQPKP